MIERLPHQSLFSLDGLTALVTGGASGIGLAIATAFAQSGARVALVDRDLRVH